MLTNNQVFSDAAEICVRGVTLSETDDPETLREKLARVIVDNMYQFVGLLDVNGMILEINRAAVEGFGIPMDQVSGTPFGDAEWWDASQETRTAVRELIRRARQGEFVRCDFKVYSRLAPEEPISVDFSILPIRNHKGEIVFLLPEGRNITEKKRAEAEIARKNDELRASSELISRQRDELQRLYDKLTEEQRLSERLLLNLLPYPIAERLKARPEFDADHIPEIIADRFAEVTVLFADLVAFSRFASSMDPESLVSLLNEIFTEFDTLADLHGLEKIKTIGDAYMAAAGLPEPAADHAVRAARMALDMVDALERVNQRRGYNLQMRIGLNSGPVVAGVIGKRKFIYDLWGDAVNIASRMESAGIPGHVQVTEATRQRLGNEFLLEERGRIAAKGLGDLRAWLLAGRATETAPTIP